MHKRYMVQNVPNIKKNHRNQGVEFKELVPISVRERDGKAVRRGPGVWVWLDALDLRIEAQMWSSRQWQGSDGIASKKAASLKLLVCFNSMFPLATEADAQTWAKLEWTVTKVTNTNMEDEVYSTTFDLSSVGAAGDPYVLQFCFHRDLTSVLVSYKGPVIFDLQTVQAARERE